MVKLLIDEKERAVALEAWDRMDDRVTGRITYAEVRAALAAAWRSGRLTASRFADAKSLFERRWREMSIVELASTVVRAAGDLAERHRLRGYGAVHLAGALRAMPARSVLVTWDADLRRAAGEIGMALLP